MAADWRQKPASHKLISWQSVHGGRDKLSLSAHTVSPSPSLDKPNLLKAQKECAASSSSALRALEQLARGQLWVQPLGGRDGDAQSFIWRSALSFAALTSEPLGSEGQILGSGHALPAVLSMLA